MRKIIVTGATGFIGRHCLPLLINKSFEVHAVTFRTPSINIPDVHWHQTDLLNGEEVQHLVSQVRPTHLLHLAWYVEKDKYWESTLNLRWIQASLELVQSFAKFGGQRLIIAGTCAEYDLRFGFCSEQITPLHPTSLYGVCKQALNLVLNKFAGQQGIDLVWGRVFFLFGPYEHPDRLVASVVRSLLLNQPAQCSHGNQIRDYLFVKDVASAFVALVESDVIGEVNIGSGHPLTIKDLVLKIAEQLNKMELIQLGVIPVSSDEPHLIVANVNRLKSATNWTPEYQLHTGLLETINWWDTRLRLIGER